MPETETENLKALKVLHQALMVLTAAILAFALRPDLSQDYKDALDELANLKQLSFAGWSNYIAARYRHEVDQNTKVVRVIMRQAGLHAMGNIVLNSPVFGEQVTYVALPTLLDLDKFFSDTQRIGVMEINQSEREWLLDQFKKWREKRSPIPPDVVGLNFSDNSMVIQYPNGSPMLSWLNRLPSSEQGAALYILTPDPTPQPTPVHLKYIVHSETGRFALDWIEHDIFGQKLVDNRTGVVFPRLRPFWHRVNQDNVDQAVVFLQGELEASARGTISFFGIPVERKLAISAGPVLSICVLVFFALHLRHFNLLRHNDQIGTYPWVALFSSPLAAIATYFSVLLLPLLANVALLTKYGASSETTTRIGAVATVLIVPLSVWSLIEIHVLRSSRIPNAGELFTGVGTGLVTPDGSATLNTSIDELSVRIKELGDKSTQVLTFLSFAIVVVATLTSASTSALSSSQKLAAHKAIWAWIIAVFPILIGILPFKEFRWKNMNWYRAIRALKVICLWVALTLIGYGLYQFTKVI